MNLVFVDLLKFFVPKTVVVEDPRLIYSKQICVSLLEEIYGNKHIVLSDLCKTLLLFPDHSVTHPSSSSYLNPRFHDLWSLRELREV